jgi:hypothetical protein
MFRKIEVKNRKSLLRKPESCVHPEYKKQANNQREGSAMLQNMIE